MKPSKSYRHISHLVVVSVVVLSLHLPGNESSFVRAFMSAPLQTRSALKRHTLIPKYACFESSGSSAQPQPSRDYQAEKIDQTPIAETTKNRRYMHQLFLMMRPINFPIVTLFHVLGVHLSLNLWKTNASNTPMLLPLLKNPSMLMVLLSLLLVTSTSMITNDYYDARNGVDVPTSTERDSVHYHPLSQDLIPYSITKTFDSYLYAILLLSSAFVPGVIPRLMVLSGAIITYLYTVHLKPRTWIKNWSCAALVAMSPITSGLAAFEILTEKYGGTAVSMKCLCQSPLVFLVLALFAGITSREILMDITDVESDARAGIQTIPVKYGTIVAANVAMGWSFLSGVAACASPLMKCISHTKEFIGPFSGVETLRNSLIAPVESCKYVCSTLMSPDLRRLLLSIIGSTMLLYRAYTVVKSDGEDVYLAEQAVGSSLISVLLVLASFF